MRRWASAAALMSLGLAPGVVAAQGVRGHLTTTARYIQMRPIRADSIAFSEATLRPDGTYEYQGRRVQCVADAMCVFYTALPVQHAVTFTQDATATAWGLGVQGLSATVSLRARADLGGEFQWPRIDDPFDAMLAYVELNRDRYRVRLGRMRTAGGLGFSGYDGASLWVRPLGWLRAEGYAGRSLARGLYEPRNEAFRAIEDFVVDRGAWLVGGHAELEPGAGDVVSLRYQREIWSDGSGLISERAALDFRFQRLRPLRITGAADYDVAFDVVGKAHLTVGLPVTDDLLVEVSARRYRPYLELWTIWGFFDPVPYHEVEGRLAWTPTRGLGAWVSGGYREYGDTHTQPFIIPLESSAVRAAAGLSWTLEQDWVVEATYRLQRGAGATASAFDARARWSPTDRLGVGVHGTAFQQIEEFRLGETGAVGGGVQLDLQLSRRVGVDGGASLYRNLLDNRAGQPDWSQVRAWTAVRIDLGTEPGSSARRLRR